jgi:hypothetical protein
MLATRLLKNSMHRFSSTDVTLFWRIWSFLRSSWNSASSACSSSLPQLDVSSYRIFRTMAFRIGGSISE